MYDEISSGYNELHLAEQQRKFSFVSNYLDIKPGISVADIGCGTAHLAKYFSDCNYTGIDPSEELLAKADANVICAPGEDVPLEDNSQDLVISLTALHNYNDWEKGISELNRIARNKVLVGVLKKDSKHDEIKAKLLETFELEREINDKHDTLFILQKRNNDS